MPPLPCSRHRERWRSGRRLTPHPEAQPCPRHVRMPPGWDGPELGMAQSAFGQAAERHVLEKEPLMDDRFEVTVGAGTMMAGPGAAARFPHQWTPGGVTVEADFTGGHLL